MAEPEKQFEQGSRHLAERNRYKRERDELLAVLFQPIATRKILAQMILGDDSDSEQKLGSRPLCESDGSSGKDLGAKVDR